MKIAFVSYEYPPETAFGGIATYVEQAALMMAGRGHQVEVFCASKERDASLDQNGIRVHRVRTSDLFNFYREVFPTFQSRHRDVVFDVVESPDYKHDGYWIAKKIPELPHVVRLHSGTDSSLRYLFSTTKRNVPLTLWKSFCGLFRPLAGAFMRGMPWRDFEGFCDYMHDIWNPDRNDRRNAAAVDIIVSPCLDLLKFQMKVWNLDPAKLALLVHPYVPSPAMMEIPCGSKGKVIGFFGQMSDRKGLRVLGQAMPLIFQRHPHVRFLFVGRDLRTVGGEPFPDYLRRQAGSFAGQLEFTGQVALKDMPAQYSRVDFCVFPSIWENFPNVCLEAMSAGRAVIASWNGGMAEILDAGEYGLLFPPNSPDQLAHAVAKLLDDPQLCFELGQRGRKRILESYSREKIAPLQEQLYQRTIESGRHRQA